MDSQIIYDCRWSNQVDDKFIADFTSVVSKVFNINYTKKLFTQKYINNIYGESIVVVVYIDNIPSAARGLWRNDLNERKAYQPGDTCVTEACRGKGVFTEMTKRSVAQLPEDAIIYNFPNQNSFPGYIKMGWHVVKEYGFAVFNKSKYFKEHPVKMDEEYANWWLPTTENLLHYKNGKDYFLVRKMNKPFCYRIVACVDENVAKRFPKKGLGVIFYRSEEKNFYNAKLGMPIHVVSKNDDIKYIPIWKIDAL